MTTALSTNEPAFTIHDVTDYPVIRVRMGNLAPGYTHAWAHEMDAFIQRGRPFVLLLLDQHGDESHDDKKTKTTWIKANKADFARLCRGFVSVEPSRVKRIALRAQGAVVAAAFGLRFVVTATVEQAEEIAQRLIAGETPLDADE